METAVIAVIGTLLGSVATHFFQRQTAERARRPQSAPNSCARSGSPRTAPSRARSSTTGAARTTAGTGHEQAPGSMAAEEARIDSYRLRSAAHQALIRVQLVCDDSQALELAASAFEVTNCMHEAPDESDRSQRSEQARETLSEFIGAAAPGVR